MKTFKYSTSGSIGHYTVLNLFFLNPLLYRILWAVTQKCANGAQRPLLARSEEGREKIYKIKH